MATTAHLKAGMAATGSLTRHSRTSAPGLAGTNGPVVIALEKDASDSTRWRSNGATLTSAQRETLHESIPTCIRRPRRKAWTTVPEPGRIRAWIDSGAPNN